MDNIKFISIMGTDGVEVEHAIIDHGNKEYTSMRKEDYEAQQEALKTPMVIDGD